MQHGGVDHLLEDGQLVIGESLHQAEVEERHPPSPLEQVVAGVRVSVEGLEAVQAAEHEAVDGLGGQVLLLLGPRQHLVEACADGQLGGQHPAAAEGIDHPGDPDERVALVAGGEQTLVLGLVEVVQLLDHALADLLHQRLRVEAPEQHAQDVAKQVGIGQVGGDGLIHPGVLHLHGHRLLEAVGGVHAQRPVHLADGGGG